MIYRELLNPDDPEQLRHAEDRLRHRLRRFGYRLQKGETAGQRDGHIQLKRIPYKHGYQISRLDTGEIVCGAGFSASYEDVNQLWEREYTQRMMEKWRARAAAK